MGLIGETTLIFIKFIQFLTPIVFYFSTVFCTDPEYGFRNSDIKYLVLPLIYLTGVIVHASTLKYVFIPNVLTGLIIIQAMYFTILSYIRIQVHKKKIKLFASNIVEIGLNWLEYIIIALIVLSVFIGGYNMLFGSADLNLFANLFCLTIVFFVAINSMRQKEIFAPEAGQRNQIIESNPGTSTQKRNCYQMRTWKN